LQGLRNIATRIHGLTSITAAALSQAGYKVDPAPFFDTIKVDVSAKGAFTFQSHETPPKDERAAHLLRSAPTCHSLTPSSSTVLLVSPAAGKTSSEIQAAAEARHMNVRIIDDATVGLAFGETLTKDDVAGLLSAFGVNADLDAIAAKTSSPLGADQRRNTPFLTHPVFNTHHSEHMMLRYGSPLPYRAQLSSQSPIHFHSPPSSVFSGT
jgi:hypothetical protein